MTTATRNVVCFIRVNLLRPRPFVARSGTLTVTESSAKRVRGTFEFVGEGYIGDDSTNSDPVDVTIEGSFDAAPARRSMSSMRAVFIP